ncbi:unnamed protein product [Symbiodinium pilosum]|uniref:Uncharacterized protein n=1 Tax=Symbiodinium pilosum TaxID=2952 RepID=A0A812SNQ8_SYMPI|nr:unnamed protein product [Symbiodinium pilosum]
MKYAEAKALSDKGPSALIAPPDFQPAAESDDGQVSSWEDIEDGQEFLGFRAVITLLSVNANVNTRKELPKIRSDVMKELMSPKGQDLPGKLGAYREFSNAVPCGWMPNEPRAAPLPHDAEPCREPPSF